MATVLPARNINYGPLQRAIGGIGTSIDQRQAEERDRAFRLYLLDQEYKKRSDYARETADYQATLDNRAQSTAIEFQSDLNAAIQGTIQEYFTGGQRSATPKSTEPKQAPTDTGVMKPGQAATKPSTPMQSGTYDPEELVPIERQGQTIYYKKKELLQKGLSDGFWDPEEHRVVTYTELKNKKNAELLDKQILAEAALEKQRSRAGVAEQARINLLQAQTEAARFNLKVSKEQVARDTEARDTQDFVLTANLADMLTEGKYSSMSPEEQAQVRQNLRAKDPKAEDIAGRLSKVDRHKYFYNEQARAARQQFFFTSLVPKRESDLGLPEEGQVSYQDAEGRVATATYLFDSLYKDYALQGRFEEAQRLPQAIVQGMKMYTMNSQLPIKTSESSIDESGTPRLTLTPEGANIVVAIKALMSGDFESNPDPPLADDERSMWEQQIADLDRRGLRASPSDTSETTQAKVAAMYSALTESYIVARSHGNVERPLPRFDKLVAMAGALTGVESGRATELIQSYADVLAKNPTMENKRQAYKSELVSQFNNSAMANTRSDVYNLPGKGQTTVGQLPATYYPEYFGERTQKGLRAQLFIGNTSTKEETAARQTLGSLINDYMLDNGEYIPPTALERDLRKYGILQNSEILRYLLQQYSTQYNSKTLPEIGK